MFGHIDHREPTRSWASEAWRIEQEGSNTPELSRGDPSFLHAALLTPSVYWSSSNAVRVCLNTANQSFESNKRIHSSKASLPIVRSRPYGSCYVPNVDRFHYGVAWPHR
jgi:hypothetical protein